MKSRVLLIVCSMLFAKAQAQYVNENNTAPVKLSDVVKEYLQSENHLRSEAKEERSKYKKEGKDYHFDRWLWYWESHTDENGYLVSPLKTYQEWEKYKNSNLQEKTTAADSSDWKFQGPSSSFGGYSGVGRINNIEFHPTDPNTYWVCTAGGGIWKTTNNGTSWICITEMLPILGTSDLKVNPLNPNTMYLCTGDRDGSDTYSIGILKSTDGGQTWNQTGLSWSTSQMRLTNSIAINKIDTNSLTLAASNGMYKSYDGGASWIQTANGNFKQVLCHPTDTNVLYASTYGNGAANIYRSNNGGASWTVVTMSPSTTNKRRITIAVTPANVAIVKAIVAGNNGGLQGIYNSTDTGKTFTRIYAPTSCNGDLLTWDNNNSPSSCGSQGWYDLSIAIDPNNASKVFVGGVNTWYSTNGGTNWTICTQWWAQSSGLATAHADKHWHAFHPLVANRLFECNDGGLYKTDNPAPTSIWTDVTNGMGITQFYRNAVADAANFVLGGAQDNGTKIYQGNFWDDQMGGDGMNCEIDYVDPTTFYAAYQYGSISRFSSTWGDAQISDNIPGSPSGGWITPYIVSPHDHDHLLAGYKHIYFSPDAGDSWMSIAGVALDPNRNLTRIAMTPASDSTIYAITGDKKIYYTHNFAPSTVAIFDSLILPLTGNNISDIKVNPKDRKHFWITLGGYNTAQVVEYKDSVWTQMNTNLPNVPVHCIELDSSNDILYVGTDVGVFYLDTVNKQWEPYNTNLPSIEVTDLGINYTTKEIWASTYGRGMWKSVKQDYTTGSTDTTDTTNIVAIIPYAADDISISPNPGNGQFKVKTVNKRLQGSEVYLNIVDQTGKVVWKQKAIFDGGGNLHVDAANLAKGIYIFEVADREKIVGRKRVIIN